MYIVVESGNYAKVGAFKNKQDALSAARELVKRWNREYYVAIEVARVYPNTVVEVQDLPNPTIS